MDVLTAIYAGQPLWLWLMFLSGVGALLWLDLSVINRKDGVISPAKSALMWAGFASLAVAFGAYVGFVYEPDPRYYSSPDNLSQQAVIQYFTGYLLETALAFDNIFVISMVFTYFAVPREYQHRVLFWGIIGAIVLRAMFIAAGAALVHNWAWVLYLFAAFLIWTGWKMLRSSDEHTMRLEDNGLIQFLRRRMRITDRIESHRFFERRHDPVSGRLVLFATPLLLALVTVEFVDIIFAVDSVPAIFAITQDPFVVYTSNIFAILGLRSMYFMLAAAVERFKYLKYGLSLVLVLIGVKIIWNFGLSKELNWVPYIEPHWSLLTTVALLSGAIVYSLYRTSAMFGPSSVRADMNNELPPFVWLIPITLLLVALLALPDVYYTLLRLAVFLSAVVIAQSTWPKSVLWGVTFIGVALLYNPVLTIHFTRETWAPINIVAATLYAAHWLIVGRKTRRTQTNAMSQ